MYKNDKFVILKEECVNVAIEKITLPAARKLAGLTQQELGALCGVSAGTISRWEKGKKEPTLSQAKRIGEVCGIHYNDIIFFA